VSNSFTMDDWEPDETVSAQDCSAYCSAYKWVVPAKVAGRWTIGAKELVLDQTFQKLTGTLRDGGNAIPITDARLNGEHIEFRAGAETYTGRVSGQRMQGTVGGKPWTATRAGS